MPDAGNALGRVTPRWLRTPAARFEALPEFPFAPHFHELPGSDGFQPRMHYLDEGPAQGRAVVLLHGEPTWSYLYRHLVGPLVQRGLRVIAPDLIGFGRSDKPAARGEHSYARHLGWLDDFFSARVPADALLVAHDWGGLLGLRLVAEAPERFRAVLVANTTLPTGERGAPEEFLKFRRWVTTVPEFSVGALVGELAQLSASVQASYDAPFPGAEYQAGPRALPLLVPVAADDLEGRANREAWSKLERFERPLLTVFGGRDPFTRGQERAFQRRVPGTRGQPHQILPAAGHFLQEDARAEFAEIVSAFAVNNR